jgi:hypothetical protein
MIEKSVNVKRDVQDLTDSGGGQRDQDHYGKGNECKTKENLYETEGDQARKRSRKLADIPALEDKDLEGFWDKNEPEDFEGWEEGSLKFTRPPKKLIQVRLDASDVRIIDRESKRTGIDRAQLVRSWVKEKIESLVPRFINSIMYLFRLRLSSVEALGTKG